MLKRKLFSCLAYVVFAASLFATACSGRKTQQESVELKKIVIAEPLHSIGYLPLYIGQQEGFFAEEGLDVEVIQATGGSHVTSVMSGDAWGVIGGVDSNAIPNASGNCPDPVIAVCNCVNRANVYLCAAVGEEYTGNTDEELAQYFKGKKINSGRFGGSPNLCVRYLLLSIGLDPDKDVVMVEPADMSTSVAVVQSGQADISWAAEPQIVDGMKSGVWTDAFYQFTDLGDYAYSVLSVSQSTIRNDPETVQHFVNAMLKSLSAAQDKKTAVRAAGKEFPTTPAEDIEAAIDRAYKDGLWSVDGIITPEAGSTRSFCVISITVEPPNAKFPFSFPRFTRPRSGTFSILPTINAPTSIIRTVPKFTVFNNAYSLVFSL